MLRSLDEYEIEIEAIMDPHIHAREPDRETMEPLVKNLIMGGADVIAPMPNTQEGLKTARQVLEYKRFMESLMLPNKKVTILPIVLVNEETSLDTISECVDNGILDGKFYPLYRTTRSQNGIKNYRNILALDKHCGKKGMRRHYHPEHPSMLFDNRDAEVVFLPIMDMLLHETEGQIIWEHGTDARCIPHWKEMAKNRRFFVTLTPHHLLTDESDSYGDVRKIFKPPAKTGWDRQLLVQLIKEDCFWVMAGSDYAPHDIFAKHVHQGRCACGAYHGRFVLPMYAHALDGLLKDQRGTTTFINFTSRNARQLYNLAPASYKIKLIRRPFLIPLHDKIGPWTVELFGAGQQIDWQMST